MPTEAASPALEQFTYGLYVVGSHRSGDVNAMTADWVMQVSFTPRMVALALEMKSRTHENIRAEKAFSVNVIAREDTHLIEKFVAPQEHADGKLGDVPFHTGQTGCPILDDALSWVECEVADTITAGDHELVIGRVVNGGRNREGEPLTLRTMGWRYGQ